MTRLRLRAFRSFAAADLELGRGLTVLCGRNGAGKTNLLEAVYFACTGRSCRTANEREVVRFGEALTRLELDTAAPDGEHRITVGFAPGQPKRLTVDGTSVERLVDAAARPLVSVFLPDRLELVVGAPTLRRAHLDQVVAALWPGRAGTRRAYGVALAQRNALVAAIRAGRAGPGSLPAWNAELARHGYALTRDRQEVVDRLAPRFTALAELLGLDGVAQLRFRPRSQAPSPEALAEELAERTSRDLERGFTEHGAHRDDFALSRAGRDLRAYGSRGQQRLGLLALLLAEREELRAARGSAPLLLLDDVMSELDGERRARLVEHLPGGGQCVLTTTELDHVPGATGPRVTCFEIGAGAVIRRDPPGRSHDPTVGGGARGEAAAGEPRP